ncbi:unnamed protein product [Dibothriocephalus latus]|uniref:Reverse transcriptase domain-containing protein n=1 Tax=Dibothriocephalus latus TaxID=60516 RepID=A0A3P6U8J4_DIBLA|nr:unnamed protein product [Dibothriocephalus latus]
MPRARRLDVTKIWQPNTAEVLSGEIQSRYTTRADGEVSSPWSSLKTSVYGAAEQIIGCTQRRHIDWISGLTLQLSTKTAGARGQGSSLCATPGRDQTRPDFYAGCGCVDQIFILRRIPEFRHSYQQPTGICFVDFAAAFVSVHHDSLWRIMAFDGVPAKIIAMIKAYYRDTTARVLVNNNLSEPFTIRSSVRKGYVLSPITSNYVIDWVLGKTLQGNYGFKFAPRSQLPNLDYADDIALLVSIFGDLQSMLSRLNEIAKSVGMPINAGKIKVFPCCIPAQEKVPLDISNYRFEDVDNFK